MGDDNQTGIPPLDGDSTAVPSDDVSIARKVEAQVAGEYVAEGRSPHSPEARREQAHRTARAQIGEGMLLAFTLQGGLALGPIARARRALQELAEGKRERIGEALPSELQALAARFDALLDEQRRGARLARERTADLAHGLRTALALLNARIRELRDRGDGEMAQALEAISSSIEQRMARELARAFIEGPKTHAAPLALRPVIERVVRAFARTSSGETLTWHQDIPAEAMAEIEEGDFVE
jgi:signal transduction histidine kinase